ncbi:MAG: hypothetical protein ACI9H6_000061 [Patiriisocius sp.]|jgi:hypothetical protein
MFCIKRLLNKIFPSREEYIRDLPRRVKEANQLRGRYIAAHVGGGSRSVLISQGKMHDTEKMNLLYGTQAPRHRW